MKTKTIFLIATVALTAFSTCVVAEQTLPITSQQAREGWIALFDGETLFGWTSTDDKVNWQVIDGAITASEGPAGFLVTGAEFSDYELHVEFRAPAQTNGGAFLHTTEQPGAAATDCYEVNIAPPDNPFPTGGIVARQKGEPLDEDEANPEAWHAFDIRVEGPNVEVKLDGRLVCDYSDAKPLLRGRIALQHNSGKVAYRDVRLKPLGMQSIFNGKDLSGWNTKKAEKSRASVTDEGELRLESGSGQLESNSQHGDFVLQLDCRVDGDDLNSGVFFRCIPGDKMNGYECQISNAMQNDDPMKPRDCGTGGFYRRQNARRIVARDHEWFTLTVTANGPHMAAWVNGYQVSDWTDNRPPHENPRSGRRLKAGTLAIQGHDPTTDLRFRDLRIVDLAERGE